MGGGAPRLWAQEQWVEAAAGGLKKVMSLVWLHLKCPLPRSLLQAHRARALPPGHVPSAVLTRGGGPTPS